MTEQFPPSAFKSSTPPTPLIPIAQQIWAEKYRFSPPEGEPEASVEQTWARVAAACAMPETLDRPRWGTHYYEAMSGFKFLPAGRILAGAGTNRTVTLFNCFVMGTIEDNLGSIFAHMSEAALTLRQGGGIGHDFSTIRPKGAPVLGVGADASGPVSFMEVWDASCKTIMSAGARRGAMMATLRCDHPDIEAFIEAKAGGKRLRNFNLSVLVTDAFMEAVKDGTGWELIFGGTIYKTVDARALWQKMMRGAYDYAEPGVIFIDRVNALNNLDYCEHIAATNPCGEEPLPPYGACLLGSINLAALVEDPFTADARIEDGVIDRLVPVAVRCLDNVIDISNYPLPAQKIEAEAKRRLGLGMTGLGDALILCGGHYGSDRGRALAKCWMARITRAAYLASAELAREKGAFPLFDRERYLQRPFIQDLDFDVQEAIADKGIRNGLLMAIAPTGTISLLAGNVSGGIEPVFEFEYQRRVLNKDGTSRSEPVQDFAYGLWRELKGDEPVPEAFVTAGELSPEEHVAMQAALQPHIDASISKTVNCRKDMPFERFEGLYRNAYRSGLKGCTAYRPNDVSGAVLIPVEKPDGAARGIPAGSAPREQTAASGQSVPLPEPLPARPDILNGFTYKLRWPASDHAIYVTINDENEGGVRRPYEVFINSKALEHYAWTVALTRMVSAIFRRGGDVSFVVEELKAVFDPRGGAWSKGQYMPSVPALIGHVIEEHFHRTGYLAPPSADGER
jgi:ribonucleoside-diphosphate reductase alpha chain